MADEQYLDLWERLIGNRKSPMRQAATVGFDNLLLLFFRRITLDDAVRRVCKRVGIKGQAIVWQHAEAGMDVDKPHQLEILREYLSRASAPPAGLMSGAEGAA